jgi:hypothetical protein
MTTKILTQDRLKELLQYDADTGVFTWLNPTSNRIQRGSICNCHDKHGYIVIRLDSRLYKSHQLAWLYIYGVFSKELDHINQIRDDNRLVNLREATRSEQMHNAGMLKNNTSGVKGVSWHKASKKWHARLWIDGKCHSLGYFDTVESAQKERDANHSLLSLRRNDANEPTLVASDS